jgi:CYTH domain
VPARFKLLPIKHCGFRRASAESDVSETRSNSPAILPAGLTKGNAQQPYTGNWWALKEEAEAIVKKTIELAKQGNETALRMCLDRICFDKRSLRGQMLDREVELKLELEPGRSESFARSLARLGAKRVGSDLMISRYFDTKAQTLRHHDLTLRVRSVGGRNVQTIKAGAAKTAGLFDRSEGRRRSMVTIPILGLAMARPLKRLVEAIANGTASAP